MDAVVPATRPSGSNPPTGKVALADFATLAALEADSARIATLEAELAATLTVEQVQDAVAAMLEEGANVTLTYDDPAGTLTVAAMPGLTLEQMQDAVAAMLQEGSNVTLTYDDAANMLTIAASGGQTGTEIVALLGALTGNARLQGAALRAIADAIDTELGSTDWRTGGTGGSDTAAQILTKLLTVDGAGSGLDADLLDGMTPAEVAALGGGSGATITDDALADDASTESTTDGASRQAIAEAIDLLAALAGAEFTGAVRIGSPSGGPLTVDGENAGNNTIMKIFTPASGNQKAFGAGRDGEFDWVQFAGEIVTGKPGLALGPGTARDTNLYREEADHLRTDDEFSADELSVHGTLADTQENLGIRTQAQIESTVDTRVPENRRIPAGGSDTQVLAKSADTDYATEWVDPATGGGGLTTAQVDALIAANLTDTPLDTDDPQSESTTAAASRQAITEAIASLGGELGAVGPFHFRINQDAAQTDSQAAHTLGGIYQNTSGRPLRVREAFVPVHPGGSGATEYNFYVWKVNRASATSYMTDVAAGASESLRTTADGTTIGHDVARGMQSTLHGFTRAEVIIAPGEYFMVAVYRSINGTAANTIVASGADVSQDYDGALEYVAKASFSGVYGLDPVEVYHNSTFAERMQLIFTFEDEGLLPPIHGIHREEIPDGRDRFPFSDEGEDTNPNAYVEWDDLLGLIRNVTVYTRSRPQATADNLFDVAISAINRAGDICLDVPHRTTAATGTWTAITPGTDLEYVRVRSNVTAPVQSRYYYEYFTDEFWFGTDVGSGVIRLIQDDANDALASFLTSGSDTVVWLHHHATDAAALLALQTLATGHEAFYWNTAEEEIRKLTAYVPPGVPETGHHYQWVRLFGGPGGDTDGGDGGVDSAPVMLFEGPDTPATYVPNVAARPNFRPLVLSRAPAANRTLQVEIVVNTPANTTANPTPSDAVTVYASVDIETNNLVGDDALPALAGAQLTTFSTSGNQGPSVGNTKTSKIARGNENDANDFGHSNIWIGHGLNADGDFVLYVAHSHWGSVAAHIIRVRERSYGGAAEASEAGAVGERSVARSIISSGHNLAITPRTFNPSTGTPGFAFSAFSFDDVPLSGLDSFSATIRVGGRAGFTINLSKEQIEYAQNQNSTEWAFTDANNYTGGSVIPCVFFEGRHNTGQPFRASVKPTRSQVGWVAESTEGITGILIFFVYDPASENINHVWTVAFSDVDVEVETMHLHYFEDAE